MFADTAILEALRITPATLEPIVLPTRPRTPVVELAPAPRRASLTCDSHTLYDGLSVPELLALIEAYRGSVNGLDGLSRKDLMVLLKHHQVRNVLLVQDIY